MKHIYDELANLSRKPLRGAQAQETAPQAPPALEDAQPGEVLLKVRIPCPHCQGIVEKDIDILDMEGETGPYAYDAGAMPESAAEPEPA